MTEITNARPTYDFEGRTLQFAGAARLLIRGLLKSIATIE